MAHITQAYDDNKLIQALKVEMPEIEFGKNAHVQDVDVERNTFTVTIDYPLTPEQLDTILTASKVSQKQRTGTVL